MTVPEFPPVVFPRRQAHAPENLEPEVIATPAGLVWTTECRCGWTATDAVDPGRLSDALVDHFIAEGALGV